MLYTTCILYHTHVPYARYTLHAPQLRASYTSHHPWTLHTVGVLHTTRTTYYSASLGLSPSLAVPKAPQCLRVGSLPSTLHDSKDLASACAFLHTRGSAAPGCFPCLLRASSWSQSAPPSHVHLACPLSSAGPGSLPSSMHPNKPQCHLHPGLPPRDPTSAPPPHVGTPGACFLSLPRSYENSTVFYLFVSQFC